MRVRRGGADAVDGTRRDAGSLHKTDEECVDVGAFSSEVAGLKHGADVTDAAAADLGIAVSVFDDPLVDGACLVDVGGHALGNAVCAGLHDTVRGNVLRGSEVGFGLVA